MCIALLIFFGERQMGRVGVEVWMWEYRCDV